MAKLTASVTIADSASLSGAARIAYPDPKQGGYTTLVGIIVPSTWSTAVISFAAGLTLAGTYYPLYTAAGTEVVTGSIAGGTAVWVGLDPADFVGVQFLKVRSGTAASATNQSSGDTLTLVLRTV